MRLHKVECHPRTYESCGPGHQHSRRPARLGPWIRLIQRRGHTLEFLDIDSPSSRSPGRGSKPYRLYALASHGRPSWPR